MVDDNKRNRVPDRPRGILTRDDRELLLDDDSDQTKNEIRDARYRIRKRVMNSVKDLALLTSYLDDRDRKLVFEQLVKEAPMDLISAYAFFYLGNADLTTGGGEEDLDESFTQYATAAIQQAERNLGYLSEVELDVTIDRQEPSIDELIEKLQSNEGTINQYNYLAENGSVEPLLEHIVESDESMHLWEEEEEAIEDEDQDPVYTVTPARAEEMLKRAQ